MVNDSVALRKEYTGSSNIFFFYEKRNKQENVWFPNTKMEKGRLILILNV